MTPLLRTLLFLLLSTTMYGQLLSEKADAQGLDEVVVSDSRFQLKRSQSGRPIIKITAQELEHNPSLSVLDIINQKSGVEINGARSNAGQNLGYFIRGGNTNSVLIIIDGVQTNNPGGISPGYDLRFLSPANIESIEILKGASAALYGSSASSAVINITTKKAGNKPILGRVSTTLGTNQAFDHQDYKVATTQNIIDFNGRLGKFVYSSGFGYQYTDGLSAAIAPKTNESDIFYKANGYAKVGYQNERVNANIIGNVNKFRNYFDGGSYLDDPKNYADNMQYRIGTTTDYKYKTGTVYLNAAYDNYDIKSVSFSETKTAARTFIADLYNKININNNFYTIAGVNYQYMGADVAKSSSTKDVANMGTEQIAPYANVVYISDFGLNINVGARYNIHSAYGGNAVYQINPSYNLKISDATAIKFYTSYGTSFIAPGVIQLFHPTYGNKNLKPEQSRSLEGGGELNFNSGRISVTYFSRDTDEKIGFDSTYKTINIGGNTHTEGVELEGQYKPTTKLSITGNYTYTYVDKTGLRVPINKGNAAINYAFLKHTGVQLLYQYVDVRGDTFYGATGSMPVILKSYSLVDLSLRQKLLNDQMVASLALNNLFNETYMEVYGYSTRGRNVLISVQYNF